MLNFTVFINYWFPLSQFFEYIFYFFNYIYMYIEKKGSCRYFDLLKEIVIVRYWFKNIWVYKFTKITKHIQVFLDINAIDITDFSYTKLDLCSAFKHYLFRHWAGKAKLREWMSKCKSKRLSLIHEINSAE